jgi:hypothetical protein
MTRWGLAVVAALCACGGKKSNEMPVNRPDDMVATYSVSGGIDGEDEEVRVDAKGVHRRDRQQKSEAKLATDDLDFLWGLARFLDVTHLPKPERSDVADARSQTFALTFGGGRWIVDAPRDLAQAMESFAEKAPFEQPVPAQRPADLAAKARQGGGEDGFSWEVAITGHDGESTDSDDRMDAKYTVTDADLDAIWAAIAAVNPSTVKSTPQPRIEDGISTTLTLDYAGQHYVLELGAIDPPYRDGVKAIWNAVLAAPHGQLPKRAQQ